MAPRQATDTFTQVNIMKNEAVRSYPRIARRYPPAAQICAARADGMLSPEGRGQTEHEIVAYDAMTL